MIAALRDELSGLFEDLCVALVTEPLDFDVKTFHQLIQVESGIVRIARFDIDDDELFFAKQHETRHMALVGLLAQATSKSLKAVRKKYKQGERRVQCDNPVYSKLKTQINFLRKSENLG